MPQTPPPYLHTRFARLSTLIHSTLLSLAPSVHPLLHPTFDLPPYRGKSSAEKDMEIIRKRRDELIARARGPPERNFEAVVAQEPDRIFSDESRAMRKCHGCGVRVTHEWARWPDGQRSLCGSCGVSGCLNLWTGSKADGDSCTLGSCRRRGCWGRTMIIPKGRNGVAKTVSLGECSSRLCKDLLI